MSAAILPVPKETIDLLETHGWEVMHHDCMGNSIDTPPEQKKFQG